MSNKDFYRAFEDKYRGSRELIKERVSIYLPFVFPLKKLYSDSYALDIGCGRGEWVELLQENEIFAQGIDLDEGMLKACNDIGLDVIKGNGIEYLQEQENESKIVISAFHVVEHISFEDLQLFVQEALRVLKPGGLLIMETPNPENIKVATENFYLDPTHIKPIPLKLLSFLPVFYGYVRTKVLRLQESKELMNKDNIDLIQVIEGASPDYAVIAQKKATDDILKLFDEVFAKDYGISLNTLTEKFENHLQQIEAKATQAEAKATQAEAKATQAEAKATQAEERATQAEAKATQIEANYHVLLNSTSWKITKPYRYLGDKYKWLKANAKAWLTFAPSSRPHRVLKSVLIKLKYKIQKYPTVKRKIVKILNYFPNIKSKLKQVGKVNSFTDQVHGLDMSSPEKLSPRGKEIYIELKKALESEKGKN